MEDVFTRATRELSAAVNALCDADFTYGQESAEFKAALDAYEEAFRVWLATPRAVVAMRDVR